jgi:hypothetical protein
VSEYDRGRQAGLAALAEWADGQAEHWQNEMYRHQALVGGSLNRIKHHGASRMASWCMNKMAIYQQVAAEARRMAEEDT